MHWRAMTGTRWNVLVLGLVLAGFIVACSSVQVAGPNIVPVRSEGALPSSVTAASFGTAATADGTVPGLSGPHQIPPRDIAAQLQLELGRQVSSAEIPIHVSPTTNEPFRFGAYPDYEPVSDGEVPPLVLYWDDPLPGDLDLNGEVNAADLLPLGRYFGYDSTTFYAEVSDASGWFSRLDSDANGVIGFGDLSGIARHYHERIDGYQVYHRLPGGQWEYLPDPSRPANPYSVSRVALLPPGTLHSPLRFSYTYSGNVAGEQQFRIVAGIGIPAEEGVRSCVESQVVLRKGEPWQPPPVNMVGSQTEAQLGHPVLFTFDFGCVAAGDFPVSFDFDKESDGEYEDSFAVSAGTATREHAVTGLPLGLSWITIRVRAVNGNPGFWWVPVRIRASNHPPVVVAEIKVRDTHVPAAIKIVDDSFDPDGDQLPVRSYILQTPGKPDAIIGASAVLWKPGSYTLRVSIADHLGATASKLLSFSLDSTSMVNAAWDVTTLPYALDTSNFSAAAIGGIPALAIRDKYYRATDAAGTVWPDPAAAATIPSPPQEGDNHLYDVRGRPFCSQLWRSSDGPLGFSLNYTTATDDTGVSWLPSQRHPLIIFYYNVPGQFSLCGGRPTVVDYSTGGVALRRADDAYGASWTTAANPISGIGSPLGLFTRNGKAIVLRQESLNEPGEPGIYRGVVSRALDFDGTSWEAPVTFDSELMGAYDGPRLIDNPSGRAVLFGTVTKAGTTNQSEFKTQYALDDTWANWSEPQSLPEGQSFTRDTAAVCNGRLCFVYRYPSSLALMLAEASNGAASAWQEPVLIDERGDCGGNARLLNVGGQPGVFYSVQTDADTYPPPIEWRFARRRP